MVTKKTSKLKSVFKKFRIDAVELDMGLVRIKLLDFADSSSIDERIKRLSGIKKELEGAIAAVSELEKDAHLRKNELDALEKEVSGLEEDKSTVESMLELPKESLSRLFSEATQKSRKKGIIVGILIGLITGFISSALVWWIFTRI